MELIIGPSNGWLYASGLSNLELQKKIFDGTNSSAIEISLRSFEDIEQNLLKNDLDEFSHKSLHLPKANEHTMEDIIEFSKKLHKAHNYDYFVIHPDVIESEDEWIMLKNSGLPIAIENMDKRKVFGIKIEELKGIIERYDFKLVLDVQHAYEEDPTMKYAEELLETFGDKIAYLHVSGENNMTNHSLLKNSRNRNEIFGFLKKLYSKINVPIILEGRFTEKEELAEEIELIKNKLTN